MSCISYSELSGVFYVYEMLTKAKCSNLLQASCKYLKH